MTPEQYDLLHTENPYFEVGDYKLELYNEEDQKIKSIPWKGNRYDAQKFAEHLIQQGICDNAKLSMITWDSKYTTWHPPK